MGLRKLHRLIGLIMFTPLLLWALTGVVFLLKPGYDGAYEQLKPKYYKIDKAFNIVPGNEWKGFQVYRTILGYHLIVDQNGSTLHLDPERLSERSTPNAADVERLVQDAISINPERYGKVTKVDEANAYTDTGVEIVLDWQRLGLRQSGHDTNFINILYKVHYLQWFGNSLLDRVFAVLGIVLLLALTVVGLALYFTGRKS